jgi:hypothetical protein
MLSKIIPSLKLEWFTLPEHSGFCKEVLSYYAMKKYCDNLGLRPSEKNLAACNSDRNCAETSNHTQRVTDKRIKICG